MPVSEPATPRLSPEDGRFLAALQEGLPLVAEPFLEIGKRCGLSEEQAIARTQEWIARGWIRRFGVVVRHRPAGIRHNAMVVWDLPDAEASRLGERMARFPFVTLCYRRRRALPHWPYNLYCMIHGTSRERVLEQIEVLTREAGLTGRPREILFSTRCHKQRGAKYRGTGSTRGLRAGEVTSPPDYDETDARLLNLLQDGIPVSEAPFHEAAAELGITQQEVVDRVASLLDRGVLSRFGPLFNVERMGGVFTLVAAAVPEDRFDEVAALVNRRPEVAHNYRREHALNLWFVTATETDAATADVLAGIERETGVTLYPCPKLEEYHLDLRLDARHGGEAR